MADPYVKQAYLGIEEDDDASSEQATKIEEVS
jgi:hypothetical protein